MLNKRFIAPLGIAAGLFMVLTQFQNCASLPAPQAENGPLAPRFFVFAHSQLEVYDEANAIQMNGTCDAVNDGAILRWALMSNDHSSQPMDAGEAVCNGGQFRFSLKMSEQMVCGLDHVVRLQSPFGTSIESRVTKRCQPLASQKLPGQCELEYNLTDSKEGGRVCEKVCFLRNRLVSSELMLQSDCQSLATQLAGQ